MKPAFSRKVTAIAIALCASLFSVEFPSTYRAQGNGDTAMPIKHLVVIFQENISFDHYFATYPKAANPSGEPKFEPSPNPGFPTPTVNGLSGGLLTDNPNRDDSGNTVNPFRLDRSQQITCDQIHDYTPEQQAYDAGLLDKFIQFTARVRPTTPPCDVYPFGKNVVMGYYDGNTVTALWNYAQNFAMSDNSFSTVFGPSSPGAINLVSGQTHGTVVDVDTGNASTQVVDGTLIGDARPVYDDCLTAGKNLVHLTGRNLGDVLNAAGVTWGWFQGGFKANSRNPDGTAVCTSQHTSVAGFTSFDYLPHHEPFQYYAATSNPHHLPPTSCRPPRWR
jgi:phospholipase C